MFHEVNLLPNVSEKTLHWRQEACCSVRRGSVDSVATGSQAEYSTFPG